jgi:hypothetical protein
MWIAYLKHMVPKYFVYQLISPISLALRIIVTCYLQQIPGIDSDEKEKVLRMEHDEEQ